MNKKWAYYNDTDPNVCEWVTELIKLGQIAPGEVDNRSIKDVHSIELKSFCQIHLFCGVAVWSYALRQSGWSDDRPVISGSCPCQSFSSAGKQRGFDDDRHLWPEMFRIIRELEIECVFGEQVASKGALAWWDLVASDLESENYAATAIDLSGASIGAPHIRSRLFWLGHSKHNGWNEKLQLGTAEEEWGLCQSQRSSDASELGNSSQSQCESQRESKLYESEQFGATSPVESNLLTHSNGEQPKSGIASSNRERNQSTEWDNSAESNGSLPTFWDDAEWLPCRDEKYRATKPCLSPLVDGATSRMGCGGDPSIESVENTQEARMMRLKGYGNAIVAPLAIEFISAVMEIIN